ncbi:hypothetical protein KAJ87_00985 [Candidatus Pacearchaeota archaeon]|nr:hypothetical protein [Candidatus Pacearchaeota archaeon]
MKQVILDTSFILTCVKQKIDFFEEIKLLGIQIIIPKQVIKELKGISDSKKKLHFREDANLSLEILKKYKFKEVDLKVKNVDEAIKRFAEKNKNVLVATLDQGIKNKINNSKLIIRQKKKLEIF